MVKAVGFDLKFSGLGVKVQGLEFELGSRVWGLGFGVSGFEFRVHGSGLGSGLMDSGSGIRGLV